MEYDEKAIEIISECIVRAVKEAINEGNSGIDQLIRDIKIRSKVR